jgi:hypothetical protein
MSTDRIVRTLGAIALLSSAWLGTRALALSPIRKVSRTSRFWQDEASCNRRDRCLPASTGPPPGIQVGELLVVEDFL